MLVPALIKTEAAQAATPSWSNTGSLNASRFGLTPTATPTPTPTPPAGARWDLTGNLNIARDFGHTETRLLSGKVLVAGGAGSAGSLNTAELYDPITGAWTVTGNLNTARDSHTATLLENGKVLVAGGHNCAPPPQMCSELGSAELYDPTTETWTNTGNLNMSRQSHTATRLLNGKVLVVAGTADGVELYDPASGTWSITGNLNLNYLVLHHTTTLLTSGKVLFAGGIFCGGMFCGADSNIAKLYDPVTGTWSGTGDLNTGRELHTATLLSNGKVLIAGGFVDSDAALVTNSAELYDPDTGTWSLTGNLHTARAYHTATLLIDDKVLVAGGFYADSLPTIIAEGELYDPTTGAWHDTASLNAVRRFHTATLLTNGKVLVAGGTGSRTAELYEPGSMTANPIDDPQFFVRRHYLDFLNREPDPAGFDFWTNNITSCGIDSSCLEAKRIDTSAAFFLSIEFQQTGYLVYRVFKTSYGNIPGTPVPVRRDEFLPDTQQIGQGVVVNQPGWEQLLESNKAAFMSEFVQRARFTSAFPTSMTPTEFVDKLYMNAGIAPSVTDRTEAINEFGSATNTADSAARGRALRRVAENGTLARQEFNKAFVLMQYFGYLQRNPNDPPELTLDFQGYNFWLNKLDSFNGDYNRAEMVKAFIVSGEYRHRFGQ